jgi:hypothetical protein
MFNPDNPDVLWDIPTALLLTGCRTVTRAEKDESQNTFILRSAGAELADAIWAIEAVDEIHYCFKIGRIIVSSGAQPLSSEDQGRLNAAFLAAPRPQPAGVWLDGSDGSLPGWSYPFDGND